MRSGAMSLLALALAERRRRRLLRELAVRASQKARNVWELRGVYVRRISLTLCQIIAG